MANIMHLDLNIEFDETTKQRRFPVQAVFDHVSRRPPFASRFQEPEPDQGSENASLHRTGAEVPLGLQNADYGSCAFSISA
jgi:hypothetical protein